MKNISIEKFPFLNLIILQSRISWSIRLRWLAVSGYFAATLVTKHIFNIQLPYQTIWFILGVLAAINGIYLLIFKIRKEFSFRGEIIFLQFHIIIDLLFLTALIHFSGGIENPIWLFYAFHVVLSSILFPDKSPVLITTLVVFLFATLVSFEYIALLPHYCIHEMHVHDNPLLIYLTIMIFTITVYMTMYICMSFMYTFRNVKRQIDQQNQQLIEADKQKSQFFRFTSHELKSPVIAVKSSIDSVLKNFSSQLDERIISLLDRASVRSAQMLEIIKELLELSKNRSRVMDEPGSEVNLSQLINEIVEEQQILADDKNIEVRVILPDNNIIIYGHNSDFKEIILNLLTNAIRYTGQNGSIELRVKSLEDSVSINIKDTGIGITEDDLPNIFKEFYRTENAKQELQIGTGLGLSIVKQIVDNYKGRIEVTSELNVGTEFNIIFPIKKN